MSLKDNVIDMLEEEAAEQLTLTHKVNPAAMGGWRSDCNERCALLLTAANLVRNAKSGK